VTLKKKTIAAVVAALFIALLVIACGEGPPTPCQTNQCVFETAQPRINETWTQVSR
jgi:hypothetical protein